MLWLSVQAFEVRLRAFTKTTSTAGPSTVRHAPPLLLMLEDTTAWTSSVFLKTTNAVKNRPYLSCGVHSVFQETSYTLKNGAYWRMADHSVFLNRR